MNLESFSTGNPVKNLRLFKIDKVHVVTFVTPFEEIVINRCQFFRNLPRPHIMSIKEAAHPGVLEKDNPSWRSRAETA